MSKPKSSKTDSPIKDKDHHRVWGCDKKYDEGKYKTLGSMRRAVLMNLLLLGSPLLVQANEPGQEKKPWSGDSEVGYVATGGNTETQTLNAKLKVVNLTQLWENTFSLEALNSSESDNTAAEKYLADAQANRKISEHNFVFGLINYQDNRFSGFEYESSVVAGFGRRLVYSTTSSFDIEAGPGVRFVKQDNADSEDEGIVRVAGQYEYRFGENSAFSQELSSDAGEERTISKSVTALKSKINSSLAMKVAYSLRHNSLPSDPITIDKTDRETAVTLVYGF